MHLIDLYLINRYITDIYLIMVYLMYLHLNLWMLLMWLLFIFRIHIYLKDILNIQCLRLSLGSTTLSIMTRGIMTPCKMYCYCFNRSVVILYRLSCSALFWWELFWHASFCLRHSTDVIKLILFRWCHFTNVILLMSFY